jgi:hypothetical protein
MYNYYAMLKSYITHPHYLARALHLKRQLMVSRQASTTSKVPEFDTSYMLGCLTHTFILLHFINFIFIRNVVGVHLIFFCLLKFHHLDYQIYLLFARVSAFSCISFFRSFNYTYHLADKTTIDNKQKEKIRTIFF